MNIYKIINNKYFYPAIIVLITLAGFCLRIINIDKPEGMWYDEIYSHIVARETFPVGIVDILNAKDTHMPLYYFFLHFWMIIFGDSDIALRMFSATIGSLLIPVVYLGSKEILNKNAGILAALLTASNSLLIYYSQEVRYYSFLTFITAITFLFFIKTLKNKKLKDLIYLMIFNLALIHTYTIGFIMVFIQTFFGILYFYKADRVFYKYYLRANTAFLTIFIMLIPFYKSLYTIFANAFFISTKFIANTFSVSHIFYVIHSFFSPVIKSIFYPDYNYIAFISSLNIIGILCVVAILINLFLLFKGVKEKPVNKILFFTLLGFFCVQIIFAYRGKLSLICRYSLLLLPVILMIIGSSLTSMKNKKYTTLITVFLLMFNLSFLLFNSESAIRVLRPGYKPIADILEARQLDKNDVLIMPVGGIGLYKYWPQTNNGNYINYDLSDILDYKNEMLYDFAKDINKENKITILKNYLLSSKINPNHKVYINSKLLNIKKNTGKIIVILPKGIAFLLSPEVHVKDQISELSQETPQPLINRILMYKAINDLDNLFKAKGLRKKSYESGTWTVLVYE